MEGIHIHCPPPALDDTPADVGEGVESQAERLWPSEIAQCYRRVLGAERRAHQAVAEGQHVVRRRRSPADKLDQLEVNHAPEQVGELRTLCHNHHPELLDRIFRPLCALEIRRERGGDVIDVEPQLPAGSALLAIRCWARTRTCALHQPRTTARQLHQLWLWLFVVGRGMGIGMRVRRKEEDVRCSHGVPHRTHDAVAVVQSEDAGSCVLPRRAGQPDKPRLNNPRIYLSKRHALPHRLVRVEKDNPRRRVEGGVGARGGKARTQLVPKVRKRTVDHRIRLRVNSHRPVRARCEHRTRRVHLVRPVEQRRARRPRSRVPWVQEAVPRRESVVPNEVGGNRLCDHGAGTTGGPSARRQQPRRYTSLVARLPLCAVRAGQSRCCPVNLRADMLVRMRPNRLVRRVRKLLPCSRCWLSRSCRARRRRRALLGTSNDVHPPSRRPRSPPRALPRPSKTALAEPLVAPVLVALFSPPAVSGHDSPSHHPRTACMFRLG